MPLMNKNHTKMIGANEKPTLSVPNRWTEKSRIKIATETPTTASRWIFNTSEVFLVMVAKWLIAYVWSIIYFLFYWVLLESSTLKSSANIIPVPRECIPLTAERTAAKTNHCEMLTDKPCTVSLYQKICDSRNWPEMDGVRIPSPITMEVPMMVTRKSTVCALLLFSSISLILWARLDWLDGNSSL